MRMLASTVALVLLLEVCLCEDNVAEVRKLRFRRPRPKLIDVENPEGDLIGSPVELNLAETALSPARPQNSGNAALAAQPARGRPRTRTNVPRRRPARPQGDREERRR